ncbi:hypothetical protein F4556_000061 [Kitasatospora gansuensis]|uniref:Uncharacterized protein n=1 Tax=Kitasatospora gansuensis TaxID=258050 RepID=A0A7W7S5Z4_9ACTN|nr:DUF6461 domain-containing protein [Kitasatospora gansuensis]MBB4944526.1 hypothetical protein [Kitasatospora gansuensis]
MTDVHASDYIWFREEFPGLVESYCLTLVEGVSAEGLLRRLGAVQGRPVTGVDDALLAFDEFDDRADGADPALAELDEDLVAVGVTELDGWAVVVEQYGNLGITREVMAALSEGTRLVAHYRNINAVDHFYWQEGGRTRLHFEPLFAAHRDGPDAADPEVATLLAACGFDLRESDDRDYRLHIPAAFALGERLTGVRLTAEVLRTATFVIGYAPQP